MPENFQRVSPLAEIAIQGRFGADLAQVLGQGVDRDAALGALVRALGVEAADEV